MNTALRNSILDGGGLDFRRWDHVSIGGRVLS